MKKNTLYILLIMLLATVNTTWAQTTVATIGSTSYTSLQAAVGAVQNGQTINLVNDVITDSKVTMKDGNYTIDFHNHGIFNANVSNTAEEYENGQSAIYFKTSNTQVSLVNFMVNGFAYPIFVEEGVSNVSLTITGSTLGGSNGRALIYNKGNENIFAVNSLNFDGLNNQQGGSEDFACFVDEGSKNQFILNGGSYTGKVKYPNTGSNNQFERLVDFRGNESSLILENGAHYTCTPADQGGLLSGAASILGSGRGNMIYFDEDAKTDHTGWVDAIPELVYSDSKASVTNAASDCYSLVAAPAVIKVTAGGETESYNTLDEAFASTLFGAEAMVTLESHASILNGDITPTLDAGDMFYITSNGFVIHPTDGKILLNPGVSVEYNGTNGPEVFGAAKPSTTILQDGTTYYAANVSNEDELGYGILEDALTLLSNGQVITVEHSFTLNDDIDCALTDGQTYTLNFGDKTITAGDGKIYLVVGATIRSDKSGLNLFAAGTSAAPLTDKVVTMTKDGSQYVYTVIDQGNAVAKIGNVYYTSLEAAINAVQNGETIVLLKDIETATPITISKGGFTIDGDGNAIICNDATVTDPEKDYLNSKGALYFNGSGAVTIENLDIKGFAYAIDVEGTGIGVTMNGGKTYGRAALNVHGNNNSFTFSGVEVHGMNNEDASGNEAFAAFVLDSDANNNELNIEDCKVIANIAHDNGYNTEKYIELRGANNKVFISGSNTSYSCTPAERAGFTNNSEDLTNDKVFFDESAKTKLNPLFASISDLQISDIESADYEGYYPLTNTVAVVVLTNAINYPTEKFMFSTIEQAFKSDKFDPTMGTELKLLGNVTLAEDITPTMGNGDMFTIDLNGKTLNGGGHHINLAPGAVVEVVGGATDATKALFAATSPSTTIVATDATNADDEIIGKDYTAANCLFDKVATLFNETVIGDGMIENNSVIDLKTDIALTSDINIGSYLTSGQSFKLNFGENNFTGGKKFLLPDGVSVTTDKQTELFKAATDGHFVLETANGNGTYTYTVYATAPADGVVLNETTNMLYTTLQAATAAANENDVIKLLANIATDKKVDVTKPMTIYGENVTLQTTADDGKYINLLPAFNFTGITTPTAVEIKGINIKGFAYAANIEHSVKNLTLSMNGQGNQEISGRAVINNWGSNNTFNVEGYAIEGLNNQTAPESNYDYEYFATFVDYEGAKANTYNIKDCEVEATVATTASDAATEKFIDLRGTGTQVNIIGSNYTYSGDIDDRGGFTNDDYVNLLVSSNKVWFDETSKDNFEQLVGQLEGLAISADQDADHDNLYPLVRISGGVRLTPDANNYDETYYFATLKEAVESDKFKADAVVHVLGDLTETEDIILPFDAKSFDGFVIKLIDENDENIVHTITFAEGKGIVLQPLVQVDILGATDATNDYFKLADETTVICYDEYTNNEGTGRLYTAANISYIPENDPTAQTYYIFEDLLTDGLSDEDVIELKTNIILDSNQNLPVNDGDQVTINFGEYDITGANLMLADGASVKTNRQTLIFEAQTTGHYVLETANADGTYTYTVTADVPGDAVARIDNRYFTTLQGAANVAQDGETIVILKNIETDEPVNITTAVTINGDGHQVKNTKQAHDAVAFTITGTGDVNINKLDIYNPNGDAVEVQDGYSGKLTFNNSTIQSSRRAIDVQNVAEGFGLTVNSTEMTVIFKEKDGDGRDTYTVTTKDPKANYVNMISAGIYFANDAVAADVLVNKSLIQGFSYGVNVSNNSGKLNVTFSDGTFYGRAIVNNWGDYSTFKIDNMTVNGLNNELDNPDSENDYEYFATIVDNIDNINEDHRNGVANYNNYIINNSTFTANADNATAPAATEKFIDLRGNKAGVKITGNTTYTYTGTEADRGGFTNVEFFLNLVDENDVWFEETAKGFFKPLVESFNGDAYGNITILDELDPVVNLYPIGRFSADVVMHVWDEAGNETKYYFSDLDKALTSPQFGADVQIDLLKNMDMTTTDDDNQPVDKEYTIDVPFTLNLKVQTAGLDTEEDDDDEFTSVTLEGVKFNIVPANSVTVLGGSTATDELFAVADDYVLYAGIIKDDITDPANPTYYAGNIYYDGIDTYSYLDFLFDESRDEVLQDEGYIRLETSFKLDKTLEVPADVNSFYLDYNGKTINPNGNAIVLKPGQEVYVNGDATDLFSSSDPEYTVMYDEVAEEFNSVNFNKKYYLMKDGLAVTVAPATYCGHEQTPTVIVKKRVEKEAPAEDEWITLTAGTDYEVKLVPSQAEDAYIAAKTYANSIIIEGKTFQGRRKADFIINPRNINDVTVTGNEQPSRDNGYTRELIANAIAAEYGCIITEHKKDATTVMTYTLKKKGATTEKPDYVVTVDLAEGQRIYEIGTYKDLITVAALEGTEGTQNFVGSRKLDFVILPGDAIDIANVLITSKAVYNSLTQIPSYESIEVTYKNGYNKVVLDPNQFKIEIHGMQHDYVDAKTYTNAITLKGTGKVGTTNSLKFYGTINADYVIMPRDLADTDFEDDKVQVVLEKNKDMDWTGEDLTNEIKIGDIAGANNIYFYMKVQTGDTYNGYRYVLTNDATTGKYDYSYTVEPSPMKDPGEYKVIFTGRGNFTGMNEVKINVLKDINAADAEIALQVIPGVNETNYTSGSGLTANDLKDVNITDGDATLSNGTHYTITLNTDPIKEEGKYTATITGKAPYYKGEKTVDFPAVYEYYTYAAANVDGNKFGIHVTSGKDKTANVGAMDNKAVNPDTQGLIINPTKNVTLTGVTEPVALAIAGIDDNAFNGGNALHYVDASQLDGYEPSSLSRNADGPFNGISKQAIVYLDGDDVIGENYVYETSAGDFRCDEFKIYDDFDGNQKGFDGEGQGSHSWEIINIHEFTAKTLTNTRYFNAGQHYTTLLPYDLPLPETLKAYNLTAASDGIFGFREIEEDALTSFMPYVLIPSAAGNLLSTTDAVVKVTATANRGFYPLRDNLHRQKTEIAKSGYVLYGSMIYMGHTSTTPIIEGTYIMQSGNQWKKIAPNSTYDGACILPMRAYILKLNDGIDGHSREFMSAKFIDGVKEMTTDMAGDDWSNAEVYDLQGRKVDTTQQMRKGVYIVNGQKRIRK